MATSADTSGSRIFPPIQPDLYSIPHSPSNLTPDQRVAQKLLGLAKEPKEWKKKLGWDKDPLAQVSFLLCQHRLGLEAELKSQWERADFYWRQVQTALKSLSQQKNIGSIVVSSLGNEPGVTLLKSPGQLQHRIVDELLIETHLAFYYGRVQPAETISLEDRAFIHLDYLENLLNFSKQPETDKLAIMGFPWMQKLTRLKKANHWKQAIKLAETRLKYFPKYLPYQNELAELHYLAVLQQLEGNRISYFKVLCDPFRFALLFLQQLELKRNQMSHFKVDPLLFLKKGIVKLKEIANRYPKNPIVSEYLGSLYYQSAIQHVNKNKFNQAYRCLVDALIYNPLLQADVSQLYQHILKIIEQFNHKRLIKINDHKSWSEPISSKDSILKSKLKRFEISLEQARYLWAEFSGTEIPVMTPDKSQAVLQRQGEQVFLNFTEDWQKNAFILWEGLNHFFRNLPEQPSMIQQAWQREVYQKPELAKLDSQQVYQLLERRLFSYAQEPIPLNTPVPPKNLPCLTPHSNQAKFGIIPVIPWIVSRQDFPLKSQLVFTGLLLIIVGSLTYQDIKIRSTRNFAYQQILNAEQEQDYLSLIQNAELFLQKRPFSQKDEREKQVIALYHEAFVRWFSQKEDKLNQEEKTRIQQYQTVLKYY